MSTNPIIMLWAHPRSMSTATERIMRNRGDCTCLHEPFMYYYYVHLGQREMPHFNIEAGRPTTFDDIVTLLQTEAENQAVFAKDMAYYVLPAIEQYPELASQFTHVFLIRDPRKSILSYYKLDPDFSCEETGLAAQWRLFEWVRKNSGAAPIVIEAETIQCDPKAAIGLLWQKLDLPFRQRAFEWSLDDQPADWKQVDTWHQKTLSKTRIEADASTDEDKQLEFERVASDAPQLSHYLDFHLPFYRKLKAYSLSVV